MVGVASECVSLSCVGEWDEESVESVESTVSAESVSCVGASGAGGVHGGTPANSRYAPQPGQ